jgi:prevent-host-death family protein
LFNNNELVLEPHPTVTSRSMSVIVNVHEAKTHLSRLLDEVHAGAEVIVAKPGKPYARRVPLADAPAPRMPGQLKGRIDTSRFFAPLPEDELAAWEGR